MRPTTPFGLALLIVACNPPASSETPISVPVVAIDDEPPDGSSAPLEVYACQPPRVGDQAEVELSVRSVTGTSERAEERNSRAAYGVRILALTRGEVSRAEVTLRGLEPERFSDGSQQMAWHTALARGWVERSLPFELGRDEQHGWCFSESGRCLATDSDQREFADAVGESLALVARPEIEEQLEGKGNDGQLQLELSPALRKRASLGVVEGRAAKAIQQGNRFPAVFRFPLHASSPGTPSTADKGLAAKLRIDRACRLRSLTTVLRTDRNDYEGLHELTWSITPGW